MEPIATADLDSLRWVRSGTGRSFQLLSGATPVASLQWERGWGTEAAVDSAAGRWTVRRAGFLSPAVTVVGTDPAKPLASLHAHLHQSTIQLDGGRTYRWSRAGFWVPAWELDDASGAEVVNVEPVREGRHLQGGLLEVGPGGRSNPDLLVLLVVSWYFVVLSWFEDEVGEGSEAILDAVSGTTPGKA